MESTNFPPYLPIIHDYKPEKRTELVLNDAEPPLFIHAYEKSECDFVYQYSKTVSIYAKLKVEIEYLQELLQDNSIKEKPTLWFDLTKMLNIDQSLIALHSSVIDSKIKEVIQDISTNPYWQEPHSESSTHLPVIAAICKDPANSSRIICLHSHHSDLLSFRSHVELCFLISLIKADVAYFYNIEHSEEWINEFSHQSEENRKQFKYIVDVHKIMDETYLNMLEKIEPELRQQYIMISARNLKNFKENQIKTNPQPIASPLAENPLSQTQRNPQVNHRQKESNPLTFVTEFGNLMKEKNEVKIFNFIINYIEPYIIIKKHKDSLLRVKTHFLESGVAMAFLSLLGLIGFLRMEKTFGPDPKILNLFIDSIIPFYRDNYLKKYPDSSSNSTLQANNTESNKRKKILPTSSEKDEEESSKRKSKKPKTTKENTENLSKNASTEECLLKNQTTAQKENSFKTVEVPVNSRENPEKEELDMNSIDT